MASFFSSDDDDDDNADSHSGSEAAVALAGADSPTALQMVAKTSSAASRQTRMSTGSVGSVQPLPPALRQPGQPARALGKSKTVTVFSDGEDSSADDATKGRVVDLMRSNSELRIQSDLLRREVDEWKGKADTLGGQLDDLQEQVEESEQSWSHEQHKRKSEWEDLRGKLEHENSQLQLRLHEWAPMQHEDERSRLLCEVAETVSSAKQALRNQGAECFSYSEQVTEENNKLEDWARSQALCLEQQKSTVERLRAELQQCGGEAREELREAELRAEAARREGQAHADRHAELVRLKEELQSGALLQEQHVMDHFHGLEAECEALKRSLDAESDSARLELQAVDLLLQEKTKLHNLEGTCQRLGEELSESRQAEGHGRGHWEDTCSRLEEELAECRKAHLAHLGQLKETESQRLEEARQALLNELAESRRLEENLRRAAASGEGLAPTASVRDEETQCEARLGSASGPFGVLACASAAAAAACSPPHAEVGAHVPDEPRHQQSTGAAMEALDWAYAAAASAGCPEADRALEAARPGSPGAIGSSSAAAAEAGRWYAKEMAEQRVWAETEVAESRREISQLRAELAAQEAAHLAPPDAGQEQRLRELEDRCAASAEEVKRMRGLLAERRVEAIAPPPVEEVTTKPTEARLATALKQRQACRAWNSSLKAAHVEVSLPRQLLGGPWLAQVQELLASALSSYDVEPSDVEVAALKDSLRCAVHIRGCRTVRAVSEALTRTLLNPNGTDGVLVALSEDDGLRRKVQVLPRWPLERLQAEIEFEYGYMLTQSQLEKLVPIIAESCSLYDQATERARSRSPCEMEALECWWSKAYFEGGLLPIEEGQRRRLLEDLLEQGAFRLGDLLEDAGDAQLSLKARLAPNTLWSSTACNDPEQVPLDHPQRIWQSGPGDPVPNATHYDPGLEAAELLLEEARARMLPLDEDPRVQRLLAASRLDLLFDSAESLLRSIGWISSHLDVLWIDNGFWNPSCLGHRGVSIGVKQLVGSLQQPHISELRLTLKEMREVQQGQGRRLYEQLSSVLLHSGVKQKDVAGVRRIVLRVLDTTDGRAAQEAMRDLWCTLSALEPHADTATEAAALLAGELRREARAQATAAGVSQEQIAHIEALVTAMSRCTDVRQEVRRRAEEEDAQRSRSAADSGGRAEQHVQLQVGDLQRRCGELTGALSAREAENEWLKAEVERLTLQAENAPSDSISKELTSSETLRVARSEFAEAEAAQAEKHRQATEDAGNLRRQLRAAEARALALSEELKQSQAVGDRRPDVVDVSTTTPSGRTSSGGPERDIFLPGTLDACVVEDPYTPVPGTSKQALMSSGQSSPSKSAADRRRLASLSQNSAAAVAKLLQEVRCLNEPGPGADSMASRLNTVKELERQTWQLERTNHEWASVVAGRGRGVVWPCDTSSGQEWSDSFSQPGASPGGSSYGAGSIPKENLSPVARGVALTSALQQTTRRLESLQGRLKDLGTGDQDF